MPKVNLEIEVTDKGLIGAVRLLTETETALRRLGKASGEMAKETDRGNVSLRDTRQAIGALSMAFGQISPAFTGAALQLGQFTQQMTGASLGSKALGGGLLAAGTAVAYLFAQFRESERIAQRFAAVNQAVRSLDVGGISSALQQVNMEMESFSRQGTFWVGRVADSVDRLRRTLLGLPSAFQEASMAEERLRGGLTAAISLQRGTESATFRGEMAGLSIQERQKRVQSQLAQGMLNPLAIELSKGFTRLNIQEAYEAAVEALDFQLQKAIETSRAKGSLDIERPAIESRYAEQVAKLQAQRAIQLFDVDEQARQQTEAVRGQREQVRATTAGLAQEQQRARVAVMQADLEAAKKIQTENEAFMRRIGVPAWMLPGVDPRAKQFIEEQKSLVLMGIDETLAKNLSAINQLKTAEEEKARLVAQATETAARQRALAEDEALRNVNELYDAARRLREELQQQGQAVQTGLVAGLDAASQRAEELASSVRNINQGMRDASGQAPEGISWEEYRSSFRVTGAGGLDFSPPIIPPINWRGPISLSDRLRSEELANEVPTFQRGGIVPGPIGSPRLVIAHGGETVIPQGRAGIQVSNTIIVNGSQEDPAVLARRIARDVGRELSRQRELGYG